MFCCAGAQDDGSGRDGASSGDEGGSSEERAMNYHPNVGNATFDACRTKTVRLEQLRARRLELQGLRCGPASRPVARCASMENSQRLASFELSRAARACVSEFGAHAAHLNFSTCALAALFFSCGPA